VDRGGANREELIEEIRRFLLRVGVPEAIFFGSRERGDFRPHSDVNLVLLSDAFAGEPLPALLRRLQRRWHADVLVEMLPLTPGEFEEMQTWSQLAREAAEHGVRITVSQEAETEGGAESEGA